MCKNQPSKSAGKSKTALGSMGTYNSSYGGPSRFDVPNFLHYVLDRCSMGRHQRGPRDLPRTMRDVH